MARPEKRLNARSVETIKKPGLHADGGGLYLHVSKNGARSWIFRWKRDGRVRDMGLGPLNTVSLAEARDIALACRKLKHADGDPIEERRSRRQASKLESARAMTFKECAEAYIAAHRPGWRNKKHAGQWSRTLETYVYPVLGSLSVQAVDVGLVMKVLEPIWNAKPETASRVRGRIESVLDWAATRGYRRGENPTRWRGHLENLLPRKSRVRQITHHAALPYGELHEFIAELRQQEGVAARALEFAILTAARTGEVIGARWEEINFADKIWLIPGNRMKSGREHRTPLSGRALEILAEMQTIRQSDYVFSGARANQPLSQGALLMLLRRMGQDDLTVHGFRSAFSDWCSERTNFPAEVREMALAHAVADKVEAAYRRGDLFQKRRQLMVAWARYCSAPVAENTATVVSIAAAQ